MGCSCRTPKTGRVGHEPAVVPAISVEMQGLGPSPVGRRRKEGRRERGRDPSKNEILTQHRRCEGGNARLCVRCSCDAEAVQTVFIANLQPTSLLI